VRIDWKHIDTKDCAAIVMDTLRKKGINALLVGGACISIYTSNKYQSSDLDIISYAELKKISEALADIGFKKKSSRHFERKGCPFFVEFVSPPAAVRNEPIKSQKEMKTTYGKIVLLTPTDCVKDRLAAYYHWHDPQSLEQALMVADAQIIDLEEVRRWSNQEGFKDKFDDFVNRLRRKKLR
jgi:hypothetical protein